MVEADKLWISTELAEKIRAHGAEAYPNECCGALLGHDASGEAGQERPREILGVYPLVNRREDSPRNRFSVTSKDVLEAERAAGASGMDVIGWYHSHPDHPARPSEYDREHAWPWYSYVIVSVRGREPKEMTSWRLQEDRERYVEEEIERKEGKEVKELEERE
jgi:proteasome lid subunit RPN8/RPN11